MKERVSGERWSEWLIDEKVGTEWQLNPPPRDSPDRSLTSENTLPPRRRLYARRLHEASPELTVRGLAGAAFFIFFLLSFSPLWPAGALPPDKTKQYPPLLPGK